MHPEDYPDTDPRHWRARRVERRRRRVFTMPVLPIDNPAVHAYLWRVIPADVGRAVADPIDAERHRLADYMTCKHTPRLCRMMGLDHIVEPIRLAQHLLTLDLYALRMLLVDIGLHMPPTMADKRRAAQRAAQAQYRAQGADRLPDTGDITRDYVVRDGVLHKVERIAHTQAHGPDVVTTHLRPVYNTHTTWCGKTLRARVVRRAVEFPWARSPEGQILTVDEIRARVNPDSQSLMINRSYAHKETT